MYIYNTEKGEIVKSTAKNLADGKVMKQIDDARYKNLGILKYEMMKKMIVNGTFDPNSDDRIYLPSQKKGDMG